MFTFPWWQPPPSGGQHLRGMVSHGYVAWRKLELHHLGCLFRTHCDVGEIHDIGASKIKYRRRCFHLYSLALVVIGWGIFYFDDFHSMQTFFNAFGAMRKSPQTSFPERVHCWIISGCGWQRCSSARRYAMYFPEFVERSCNERRVLKQSLFFAAHLSVSLCHAICSVALLVGRQTMLSFIPRF